MGFFRPFLQAIEMESLKSVPVLLVVANPCQFPKLVLVNFMYFKHDILSYE